jgi:hypothetical protein
VAAVVRSQYGRYRRRTRADASSSSHTIFGSTGWLFADLLLALALVFLLAATFIVPMPKQSNPPPPTPTPSTPTPTPSTPTPTPSPTESPEPALDLKYIKVPLDINPDDISASSVQSAIAADPKLAGRQAGLVILFAGGPYNGSQWEQIDAQVWTILQGMDTSTPLFKVAVSRKFWDGTLSPSQVELNVYLFKEKS